MKKTAAIPIKTLLVSTKFYYLYAYYTKEFNNLIIPPQLLAIP